jgi:DNA repair protein RecN (Recombination protein N)
LRISIPRYSAALVFVLVWCGLSWWVPRRRPDTPVDSRSNSRAMSVSRRRLTPVLAEMRIAGLGVIDEAQLELHRGLTVVTGETGAGKTMVVTGLHLLGGGRADASRVRAGADKAVVEGRFEPTPPGTGPGSANGAAGDVTSMVERAGGDVDDDGALIVVRTVAADGRSRAYLGGRSVPAGVLGELSDALLAVHGQNDQLRLLRSTEQRAVLDRFAGAPVTGPLEAYRSTRQEWVAVVQELAQRRERAREMAREADLLRHGLAEIEAVDPKPGEDGDLVAEGRRLADVDQLRAAASAAQVAVVGDGEAMEEQGDSLRLVGDARRRLGGSEDPALRELEPRLAEAASLLADVGAELTGYLERLQADPARLEQVLARQAELKGLTRKYAADVDGVLAWAQDARERLNGLDTSEEALAELDGRRADLAERLAGQAAALSAARRVAAGELAESVTGELAGLAMPHATLQVAVEPRPGQTGEPAALMVDGTLLTAGPDGTDEVELRLIAHPGAPPLAVHKGASGGELSRVMLAIEVVLAGSDTVPTLVFDEVDAGVGGRAAVEVGRRLAMLARSHQVIVVTHLAQVAAFADRHLVVDKATFTTGLTRSGVRELDQADRVVELARMLAGLDATDTGRAHAEELLEIAAKDKALDAGAGRHARGRRTAAGRRKAG